MSDNIFTALQSEIERVTRKHERWKGMMEEFPEMKPGMSIGAGVMKAEIDAANEALASHDPARIITALESLKGYDDND